MADGGQPDAPRRGGWGFSSMRVRRRTSNEEDGRMGFGRRMNRLFSSVRTDSRRADPQTLEQDDVRGSGAAAGATRPFFLRRTDKMNSEKEPISEDSGKEKPPTGQDHCAVMAIEDEADQGRMKRFSTMLNHIHGKLTKERGVKDPDPPQPIAAPLKETPGPTRETSYASGQVFFEYLVVVSLKRKQEGVYEPQITYQFPKRDGMMKSQKQEEEKTLKAITLFCFPEGINWTPLTEYRSETFSFVLTEIDGSRRNGYCRRLLPHGKGARPPEAYCIISQLACFGLFSKIFDEVEKRRQISMAMIYPFMQSLREAPFPAPGHTVKIKSFIPESGTEIISLTRPLDSWLEHVDFRTLFRCLTDEEVLQVFAATVMERRIIFIAEELSTLSQVINAVAALLYPFTWQHTFISIVPEILIDVVMAPTPYLLGVQKHMLDFITDQSDLLIVDLSEGAQNTFITTIGDEKSILPPKLQDEILQALSARKEKSTPEELNRVVSEAFLPFFVKTVGHFAAHVKRNGSGQPGVFQKRNFYKAIESKTTRHFVKKFIQTQMFDLFIQEVEQRPDAQEGFFHKKIAEYQEKKKEKTKKL
ncbi:DENN/MADD domain containing 2Db isoform X1 [Megalops cyprinoides]|uniref:DENN/MADD domain containing 2Db isoform X1 n=1 Tax=Megalops cyprinoides TaxID=118141 RepID=UPI001864B761|nr:DENN/MADD domain containing 2Db isoform X1 [Megalops cyprinoides]